MLSEKLRILFEHRFSEKQLLLVISNKASLAKISLLITREGFLRKNIVAVSKLCYVYTIPNTYTCLFH